MYSRVILLWLALARPAFAQQTVSIAQLQQFIRSAIETKQPDKQVAATLHNLRLKEKLTERTVEQLQGEGAGPKTIAALKDMSLSSQALAAPPPPAPPVERKSIPPPSYEDQQKIINEAREYALNYSKSLPDFICKQAVHRYYDPLGKENWRSADVLVVKLSYAEQKEHYQVMLVNGQTPVGIDRPMEAYGGTTSSGEFGSLLRYIFEPGSDAEFHWDRWGRVRNHVSHVFNYSVEQAHSQWAIVDMESKRQVVPAYSGQIFVDRDTKQILRVTLQSQNVPADFPIQTAQTVLDYDYAAISGRSFLLPLKAEIRLDRGAFQTRNDIAFRSYQKFSADAVITFDTSDAEDGKAPPEPPGSTPK